MSRSIIEYFNHIITELYFLRKASIGLDLNNFLQDETLKRTFAHSLEIKRSVKS